MRRSAVVRVGVDPDIVQSIARADRRRRPGSGTQVAVVIGGGNYFRGAELSERGMDRARADYMGMLGTVMNCLALQDFLEKQGVDTRVQTAITMGQVAEPYIPRRGDPPPREGPRRHLRRRSRRAVLLHRHRRPPSARWRSAPRSLLMAQGASTGSTTPTRGRTPTRSGSRQHHLRRGPARAT
ncbi:MAG: hypothetical protein QM755_14985 [Luteolibacter sp.]